MQSFDVVTGGAGFIGSHLCETLLRRDGTVRIIDNLTTGRTSTVRSLVDLYGDRVDFIEGDIRDYELVRKAFQGANVVYHQAAIPSVQRSVQDPLDTNSANVTGTLNVLLAARETGVERVVYASSSSIYGDSPELPKSETQNPDPISPYGVSKYAAELYSRVVDGVYGLPTVGLRYFNVFGPRQDPQSEYAAVIPKFITRMLKGLPPVIYGNGEQSRDFTYIDNVVDANLKAAVSETSGVLVNVACGQCFNLNQLVRLLNEMMGTDLAPVYEKRRPGDIMHSLASVELASEAIGYTVSVGFRDGLEKTVRWFRQET